MFCSHHTLAKKIRQEYISQRNSMLENKVILLMITDVKKWHYIPVKSLSALLRGIALKNSSNHYCINCLHSFRTENKLKAHENFCINHDYCYIQIV